MTDPYVFSSFLFHLFCHYTPTQDCKCLNNANLKLQNCKYRTRFSLSNVTYVYVNLVFCG